MKLNKKILLFVVMMVGSFLALTHYGLAQTYGADVAAKTAGISTQGTVSQTIGKVIGIGLSFLGVVFFVLMVYGGYYWMIARGDPKKAEKGRDVIIDAIIGLVIVLAAYAITNLVVNQLARGAAAPTSPPASGSPAP